MPNNYFQFKQFTIQQDKCAMKVCTDACLFGAWMADNFQHKNIDNILDIGTGTGLLSLMLAQKNNGAIDAVEIDSAAFEQAAESFKQSHWDNRLHVIHTDIKIFNPSNKYNCIISNPPFFEDDLKSDQQNKNAAKHDTTLTLDVLINKVKELLTADGSFAVLLPFHRTTYFIDECLKLGLFCNEKVLVKQTSKHTFFRSMLLFTAQHSTVTEKEITIKDATGNYSADFTALLKDYYLYL